MINIERHITLKIIQTLKFKQHVRHDKLRTPYITL